MELKMRILCFLLITVLGTTSFAGNSRLKERKRDAFSELNAKSRQGGDDTGLALRFFNALTGQPLSSAKVRFGGTQRTTNTDGRVLFDWPKNLNRREDRRQATVEHKGFITSTIEVHFIAGSIFNNRFSISPTLAPRQVRVVLDWAKKPADLDAHLVKAGAFHISYQKMKNWRDLARLDRDDLDGFGPETITVDRLDSDGKYTFAVHDYSNQNAPSRSNLRRAAATVRVFSDGRLTHQFIAPKGSGNAWVVFEISGGKVIPINRLQGIKAD
jgi:hypothetical protein